MILVKHPSADNWVNKVCSIPTVECYAAIAPKFISREMRPQYFNLNPAAKQHAQFDFMCLRGISGHRSRDSFSPRQDLKYLIVSFSRAVSGRFRTPRGRHQQESFSTKPLYLLFKITLRNNQIFPEQFPSSWLLKSLS